MRDNTAAPKPGRGSAPAPDHIMLSFSGDPRTTAAVTWRTDVSVPDGFMLYREDDGSWQGETLRAEAVTKRFESDIDVSNIHSARAEGLKPGTRYVYTVGCGAHRSGEFSFETEPPDLTKFKFLIIADHQQGRPHEKPDYSRVGRLLKDTLAAHPDCRFILTAGDNCDNGQNELQWNGMFSGLAGIIESVPYMMATGNHDNRGFISYLPEPVGKFYLKRADFFDAQFGHSYPKNGPDGYITENYSFDYGNVHFLVMGINAQETVADWAYDDLRASEKTWKLGAYHFPIYPVMPEGENADSYPCLRKPIEEGRLDVLLAGHEHSFARTYPMKNDELFDRPSKGVVHYICGNGGANVYISNCRKIWHSAFYAQEEPAAMVTIAEVDGAKFTLTALLDDGRVADVFVIDKDADTITPPALAPIYRRTKLAYKGDMLEFAARGVFPCQRDSAWYIPAGVLIGAIGGAVSKTAGKVTVGAYKRTAAFTEDSDIAETGTGDIRMSGAAFRGDREQLYVPLDDFAKIFGMNWQYAARNNFINIDHPSENTAVSEQP